MRYAFASATPNSCSHSEPMAGTARSPDAVLDASAIATLRGSLSPEMREQMRSGFAAVLPSRIGAIENAIRAGDPSELRRTAHLLRGTAITMGASALSEMCKRLETAAVGEGAVDVELKIAGLRDLAERSRRALDEELS